MSDASPETPWRKLTAGWCVLLASFVQRDAGHMVTNRRATRVSVDGTHSYLALRVLALTRLAAVGLALTAGILFVPATLGAEPRPSVRVAILNSLSTIRTSSASTSFVDELQRLGYVEGRNLTVVFVNADDKPARLPDLAQELVRLKPDAILTMGTMEATDAAMKATSTIPIVFVHAVDPVRTGLVASLARPGGNVTGVTSLNADLDAKRFELLTEIVPGVKRVAVLTSPVDPEAPLMQRAVVSAARARRVQLDFQEVRDAAALGDAVGDAKKGDAGALLVLASPPLYRLSLSLAPLTVKHRLPTVSAWREFAEAGGLASYGADVNEMFRRAAGLMDRILKGARPADLPVEQPTTFELVINLKTARAFKLKIPESILLRADGVIR